VSDNAEVGGGERARDGGGSVVVRFSHERDAGASGIWVEYCMRVQLR